MGSTARDDPTWQGFCAATQKSTRIAKAFAQTNQQDAINSKNSRAEHRSV
jgi:hypothetical protein